MSTRLQTLTVRVDRGYRPRTVRAVAHRPLRLLFERFDRDDCTEKLVFSSPPFEARLPADEVTTIDLPPQPAGTVRFTCGEGRYRGEIEFVETARLARRSLYERAAGLPRPMKVVAVAAVLIVALLVLGVPASTIAPVAMVGGCLGMHFLMGHGPHGGEDSGS